jgi:hypothetical protein
MPPKRFTVTILAWKVSDPLRTDAEELEHMPGSASWELGATVLTGLKPSGSVILSAW